MDPTELERAVAKRADISAGKVGDVLSALKDVRATEGDSHDDIALRRLVVEGFVRPNLGNWAVRPWEKATRSWLFLRGARLSGEG